MRIIGALLLTATLAFAFSAYILAEKAPNSEERSFTSRYAEREAASRNFAAWWKDHAGYLIVPADLGYAHPAPTEERLVKLMLMVGYRGEFEQILRAQAVNELSQMPSAVRFISKVATGEKSFDRRTLPKGVRTGQMQAFAATALGDMGFRDALPALGVALDSEDASVKAAAAVAIGKLGGLTYRQRLLDELKNPLNRRNPYLRSAILAALAYLADPFALPDLVAHLDDKDPRVRLSLATVFGLMAEGSGPKVVNHYLTQYNEMESVRLAAVWTLAEIGRELHSLDNPRDYTSGLVEVEDILINRLTHENKLSIIRNTMYALGHLGTDRALRMLRNNYNDTLLETRIAAAVGLALAGEELKLDVRDDPVFAEGVNTLIKVRKRVSDPRFGQAELSSTIANLHEKGLDTAAAGVVLLASRSYANSRFVFLSNCLEHSSSEVSSAAVVGLGMLQGGMATTKASAALQSYLNSKPSPRPGNRNASTLEENRALAYVALGMLDSDRTLRFLYSRLRSKSTQDSVCAALSLSMLGGLPYRQPLLSTIYDRNNSPAIRSASTFALGLARAPGVLESLIDIIRTENNIDLRANAVFALALHGDTAAVPVLNALLADKRLARSGDGNYLRGCAALALARLTDEPFALIRLKVMLQQSDDENFKAFAALALGIAGDPDHLQPLADLLNHHSASVRLASAIGLGLSGDKDFLPEIRQAMLSSRHDETRVHAAIACGMLGDLSATSELARMLEPKNEPSSAARIASAFGLMLLGKNDPDVAHYLSVTANDPDPRVRKYAAVARFVLGDRTGLDTFIEHVSTGGMNHEKLDSMMIRDLANQSLPTFFKLRSYLYN